jgi:hypothetical protein
MRFKLRSTIFGRFELAAQLDWGLSHIYLSHLLGLVFLHRDTIVVELVLFSLLSFNKLCSAFTVTLIRYILVGMSVYKLFNYKLYPIYCKVSGVTSVCKVWNQRFSSIFPKCKTSCLWFIGKDCEKYFVLTGVKKVWTFQWSVPPRTPSFLYGPKIQLMP